MARDILVAALGAVVTAIIFAIGSSIGNGTMIHLMGGARQSDLTTLVEDTPPNSGVSTLSDSTQNLGSHDFCILTDVNMAVTATNEGAACTLTSAGHAWTLQTRLDPRLTKMPLTCTAKCFSFIQQPERPKPASPSNGQ
jgi:hypothetical protein